MQRLPHRLLATLLAIAFAPLNSFAISKPHGSLEKQPMNQKTMEDLIRRVAENVEGETGALRFTYDGVALACVSDVQHDRMRLIAPIASADELTQEQWRRMLDANCHTALDARYATSDGVLYSAFIHPLSPLTAEQLNSALHQVAMLAKTFGSSYTSGTLSYGEAGTEL